MSVYTITYYLKEASCGCGDENHDHDHNHDHAELRDDRKLVSKIHSLGQWALYMPDSFLVKSEFSADEILSELKDFLEPSDLILVSKIDPADTASLTPGVVDWINS